MKMHDQEIRILLVDDDEDDYLITKDMLSEIQGFRCHIDWIPTYNEAMIEIRNNKHDVYLFDYRIGSRNGLELLEEAILCDCRVPIIILTGQDDIEVDIQAMKAGASDYLVKGQIYPPLIERTIRYAIDRKKVEQKLKESLDQFRVLFEDSPDAFFVEDKDGNILDVNNAACKLHGMNRHELIGKNIIDLVPPDMRTEILFIQNQTLTRESKVFESLSYTKDGRSIPVEIRTRNINYLNKPVILFQVRDISERKILESQLLQAQKLESIGQLAAGVAHEINTPTQFVGDNAHFLQDAFEGISSILSKYDDLLQIVKEGKDAEHLIANLESSIIEHDLDYLYEEIPNAIRQSLDGIARISTIVRAMKDFSHPGDSEKMEIDLNESIETTITVSRNEWKYVADVITEYDPNLSNVPCLVGEFNQAILNIIINAAHAIADNQVNGNSDKGVITIKTRKLEDWAEITISDTGTGIPENIIEKIFDPFFTTKEVGKGTGQGLAITHSVIVQKHGGHLSLESVMGKGTTFKILLPFHSKGVLEPA